MNFQDALKIAQERFAHLTPDDPENLIAFDAEGHIVVERTGTETSVGMFRYEQAEAFNGFAFHTHPKGGIISAEDMIMAFEMELQGFGVLEVKDGERNQYLVTPKAEPTLGEKVQHLFLGSAERADELANRVPKPRNPLQRQAYQDEVIEQVFVAADEAGAINFKKEPW